MFIACIVHAGRPCLSIVGAQFLHNMFTLQKTAIKMYVLIKIQDYLQQIHLEWLSAKSAVDSTKQFCVFLFPYFIIYTYIMNILPCQNFFKMVFFLASGHGNFS
jgi:hypothetical protein